MSNCYIPAGYRAPLTGYDMQRAIEFVKSSFQENLKFALNLRRVSAPLFVDRNSGLNDNLNGVERPVSFDIPAVAGATGEVVHSLAKWKRLALKRYGFYPGNGLYTDMNAIRRDENLDNIHSVYVDQWDWEKVITPETRTEATLRAAVKTIVQCIVRTLEKVKLHFPAVDVELCEEVAFVTTRELEARWPELTAKQREQEITKQHKTVFLMQIGGPLANGKPHDGRAPDYDDWSLNGDIILYYPPLATAFEVSSMGIRVDKESLLSQLKAENCMDRLQLDFHKALLGGELPLTMGGGIGQSRLSMFLLEKMHIGEVQVSVWDEKTYAYCKENNIQLM